MKLILLLVIALWAAAVAGSNPYKYRPRPPTNRGQLCNPPVGYQPGTCGYAVEVSRSEQPAPVFKYGPNVCFIQRSRRLNVSEHRFQQRCDWVYNHHYYDWVRQCSQICRPTSVCTSNTILINDTLVSCCEGFTTRPPEDPSHQHYYYQQYYTPIQTQPVGCPVAIGDTLLECLELHQLTDFLTFFMISNFSNLLNTTGDIVTVFAPTDAAFERVSDQLVGVTPNMLIGNHIVNGTVQEDQIRFEKRFETFANTLLHGTTVVFYDYSYFYNPHSYTHTRIERFINGARITVEDACKTPNRTLHIIDRVLMPSNQTIATILSNNTNYTRLVEALEFVGLLEFLNFTDTSRTLFAPPNEVFDRVFPPDLFNCLTVYMRRPLNDILLFHIVRGTEYTSSISIQTWLYTLLLRHIRVQSFANGTIFLGSNFTSITRPDIPARNGVIHEVDNILIPPNFNFGMCQRFVPTPPPPPTPSPSPSPTPFSTPSPTPFPTPSPTPGSGLPLVRGGLQDRLYDSNTE